MKPEPKYKNPYLTSDKPAMMGAELYRLMFLPLLVLASMKFDFWRTIGAISMILFGIMTIIGVHYEWTSLILAMQTPLRFKIQPKKDFRIIERVKKETFIYGLMWIVYGIILLVILWLDL